MVVAFVSAIAVLLTVGGHGRRGASNAPSSSFKVLLPGENVNGRSNLEFNSSGRRRRQIGLRRCAARELGLQAFNDAARFV
jgi:hypothetical protein